MFNPTLQYTRPADLDSVAVTVRAPFEDFDRTMELPMTEATFLAAYREWKQGGVNVQDAFPTLNADQREFLLTGLSAEEWDNLFSEENA